MEVADLEVTTRERYEDLIRLYIVPTFGDLQAGRLDAELLERFYARLHRCKAICGSRPPRGHVCTPLSTSTTRKIHYLLRGALGRAARWGYVSVNAAELAQAPSPRKPRPTRMGRSAADECVAPSMSRRTVGGAYGPSVATFAVRIVHGPGWDPRLEDTPRPVGTTPVLR